jgi:hypothetical protein
VRLVQAVIWVATAVFVVLLFTPLVRQMLARLADSGAGFLP